MAACVVELINNVPVLSYSDFTGVSTVSIRRNSTFIELSSAGTGTYEDTSAVPGLAYSYEVRYRPGGVLTDVACAPETIIVVDAAVELALAAGAVLGSPTQSFSWSANDTLVDEWWIYAGSSLGSNNYYDSGNLSGALSTTVSGLPSDGSTVYIRLWHRQSGGTWSFVDTTYEAATASLGVSSPLALSLIHI